MLNVCKWYAGVSMSFVLSLGVFGVFYWFSPLMLQLSPARNQTELPDWIKVKSIIRSSCYSGRNVRGHRWPDERGFTVILSTAKFHAQTFDWKSEKDTALVSIISVCLRFMIGEGLVIPTPLPRDFQPRKEPC
jgi:hypothetical protein